jgi:NitT/TauT family transport system ATP-binding protein
MDIRNLTKNFPGDNDMLQVLEGVSFSIQPQEFVCIVGPSGCGKSTLLRLLDGLLRPSSGEIIFEGKPLQGPKQRIGFVFQEANLMPWRTTIENIILPLELKGLPREVFFERAQSMIELVGLKSFEAMYPRDLSGGMAQRVAIARALISEPDVLLLDEPFGALDALTRERMGSELIRVWKARKVTVLMVTHSIDEAVLLSDRVLVLSRRPASVCLNLPISLPRPRKLEMTHTQAFGKLAGKIREGIQSS